MKKGFTLIELIITVALFAILVTAASWVFLVGSRAWESGRNRAGMRQDAALAMERMVREIGLASEITRARADEIDFEADMDQDELVEEITFDVSNDNNLERTVNVAGPDTAVIMARDVQSFTLGYYLEGDNGDLQSSVTGPTMDEIRVVVITLTLSNGDETVTLSASAYARNQGLDDE